MARQSSTTTNIFTELVKKNIRRQYKTLCDFYTNDLPEDTVIKASGIAEKVGWQSGKPQVISQLCLYQATKKLTNFIVFNHYFNISVKSWKKWKKIIEDKLR